jgi:hypothetical protein
MLIGGVSLMPAQWVPASVTRIRHPIDCNAPAIETLAKSLSLRATGWDGKSALGCPGANACQTAMLSARSPERRGLGHRPKNHH